jgi:hypothetical protein
MKDESIGDRYAETLERFKRLSTYDDQMEEAEQEFVSDMIGKLETYKSRTYITVRQLNWLTRIEAKVL